MERDSSRPYAGKVTLLLRDDILESYFTDIFSKNQ